MAGLVEVTGDVLVATHAFCTTTTTVVTSDDGGCLVVDPGVTPAELDELARELAGRRLRVVAGFATHAHWDHVLWSRALGEVPRYATAAATVAAAAGRDEGLAAAVAEAPRTDGVLFGRLTALPGDGDAGVDADAGGHAGARGGVGLGVGGDAGARGGAGVGVDGGGDIGARGGSGAGTGSGMVPSAGPRVVVVEHRAHAPGHAALVVADAGVLIAGDMCSDLEVPLLDRDAADPLGDYHHALDLFEALAADIWHVVPGHGHVGDGAELRRRLAADRGYLDELAAGRGDDDPRLTEDWMVRDHRAQRARLTSR